MAAIQWISCDPVSGQPIEELPGLQLTSSLSRILGKGDNASASLPIRDRLPARWKLATQPDRAIIAACYDDAAQTPLWVGIVTGRAYGNGPTIDLRLEQAEAWLGSLYTPDLTFVGADLSQIMRTVGLDYAAAWFHGQVSYTATGATRDQKYLDADDKPRLTAMQELMRLPGGPEFTINWTWDGNGCLVAIPTVAPRIGRAFPNLDPTFVLGRGTWAIDEDYSAGRGATIVTGTAIRQGDRRTTVSLQANDLLGAGWLPREYRYQPDTTTASQQAIANVVAQRLADMRLGGKTLSFKNQIEDLVVGVDFNLGDDIGLDLTNPDLPGINLQTVARAVGWVAEANRNSGQITTITPVLLGDDSASA